MESMEAFKFLNLNFSFIFYRFDEIEKFVKIKHDIDHVTIWV